MSVSTTTTRYEYTGNSSTTAFNFNSYFLENSDLVVYLVDTSGNEFLQVYGTDYSVAGAGASGGGVVTFVTAPTTAWTIIIFSSVELTQPLVLNNNDPFSVLSVTEAFDRLCLQVQRMQDQLDRAVTISDGFPGTFTPQVIPEASSVFGMSADGTMVEMYPLSSSGASPVMQQVGSWAAPVAITTSIAAPTGFRTQMFVVGSGGPQVDPAIANGSASMELFLIGTSDTNSIQLDNASNLVLNGEIVLKQNTILYLQWITGQNAWVEVSRNEI